MYVVSSFTPEKQSLAGGIFNTVVKICGAVGLGISSSIYSSESTGHVALQTSTRPYSMVFWFCFASSAFGLCLVPFLTIGTQGHATSEIAVTMHELNTDIEERKITMDNVNAIDGDETKVGAVGEDFESEDKRAYDR